jgi:hypothetical protein
MTRDGDHEDRRLRRKSAAFRLKHDVGKALRWSAPDVRESDVEALRERLASDLLPSGDGAAKRDVLRNFFEWKKEERELFDSRDPDLTALAAALSEIERALPGLPSFEESELLALDESCLEASRRATSFYRRVALDDGLETIRPHRASR